METLRQVPAGLWEWVGEAINEKEKAQKFKHMIPELYFYVMHIFLLQNNNKSDTKEEYDGCNQRTDNDKKVDEHISTLPVGL